MMDVATFVKIYDTGSEMTMTCPGCGQFFQVRLGVSFSRLDYGQGMAVYLNAIGHREHSAASDWDDLKAKAESWADEAWHTFRRFRVIAP